MIIVKQLNGLTRKYILIINCFKKLSTKSEQKVKIAVSEAEKIVGYPTSFLNSKWLENIEATAAVPMLSKITDHPVLAVARDFVVNPESPSWALVVSLVSKAGGVTKAHSQDDYDITSGILRNQREVAVISEMLRKMYHFHNSVVHTSDNPPMGDTHFGNKIGIISGDYIISTLFEKSANLRDYDIFWLVFSCLRDLSEQSFFEPTDRHNHPLPARPTVIQKEVVLPEDLGGTIISEIMGNSKAEWTLRHLLGGASTLGKCCQSAIQLAHEFPIFQKSSYLIGRNTELALQVKRDISQFNSDENGPFSFINAPLMFHFQEDPDYYDKFLKDVENDNINYTEIRNVVSSGNGIEKALELQEEFVNNVIENVYEFPESTAKDYLINLL